MGSAFPTAASHFELEDGAFLGLPTLLILGLLARRSWRSPWTRFLLSAFLLSGVLTLGTALRIDGRRMVYLPLRLARHVPALDNVHWDRCAVYLALCGAVGVATWIGRTRGRVYARPVVLPVFALVAVMPAFWRPDYPSPLERWPFFTSALYRSCLADNERELVFPFGYDGDSMLWQAESGYRFTLAEGYLHAAGAHAPILSSFERDPVAHDLASGRHPTMRALRAFAARKGVTHVIVTPDADYPSEAQLQTFGSVERVGGVLVAPACNVG
jgi:hypothetical protein